MFKFRLKPLFLLFLSVLLIGMASTYRKVTELVYTNFLNRFVREGLSNLSGKVPFPMGDILTVLFIALIIFGLLNLIKKLISTANILEFFYRLFWGVVNIFSLVVFFYVLLYGLNFYTTPLQQKMINMYNEKYATNVKINIDNAKMIEVYNFLEQKAVETKKLVNTTEENYNVYNLNSLSKQGEEGFRIISEKFPMMAGNYSPAKISLGSNLYSFFGLDARYYLLTNEISINKNVPNIYLPFLVSKYMAFQRGAAREDEASFYAYIACINNSSPEFKYSGYLSALYYLISNLRVNDKIDYNTLVANMNPEIRKDLNSISNYKDNYGSGSFLKNKFVYNFKRINGDIRPDNLDYEVSTLISSYYSLFTY